MSAALTLPSCLAPRPKVAHVFCMQTWSHSPHNTTSKLSLTFVPKTPKWRLDFGPSATLHFFQASLCPLPVSLALLPSFLSLCPQVPVPCGKCFPVLGAPLVPARVPPWPHSPASPSPRDAQHQHCHGSWLACWARDSSALGRCYTHSSHRGAWFCLHCKHNFLSQVTLPTPGSCSHWRLRHFPASAQPGPAHTLPCTFPSFLLSTRLSILYYSVLPFSYRGLVQMRETQLHPHRGFT